MGREGSRNGEGYQTLPGRNVSDVLSHGWLFYPLDQEITMICSSHGIILFLRTKKKKIVSELRLLADWEELSWTNHHFTRYLLCLS